MEESRFTVQSCLGFIVKAILFILLLGIVLGGVWMYTCVFKFPEIPTDIFPKRVVEILETAIEMQNMQCGDLGYWFGKDATRNEKLLEQSKNPEEEIREKPQTNVPVEENNEEQCGTPSIEINPSEGSIGDTYTIYLKGFASNDTITACWYFPNGEEVNCKELDANGDGFRETAYWSEENDPPGEYGMKAQGNCSHAEITWVIEEK